MLQFSMHQDILTLKILPGTLITYSYFEEGLRAVPRIVNKARMKLVHHYFGADWDIIDDVLKNEFPSLKSKYNSSII
jgi:uncharacterized protein with HEPN domain